MDRISVSFPVAWHNDDRTAWNTEQVRFPGTPMESVRRSTTFKLLDEATVFVGVEHIQATGLTWAKVEMNPARVVDPEGHGLCPVEDVRPVLTEAVASALHLIEPTVCNVGEMNTKRLDVARDFTGVTRPAYIVSGLGPVHRPWARRNLVHLDPSRNGAQTLMVGSGAGVVRLYDKDAETGGEAPETLRWEAECRSDWCDKYGDIRTVGDVTAENVMKLALNRWEWSAMGNQVTAKEAMVEKVMRSGLSYTEQRNLIGYLVMLGANADVRMAKATASKYRKHARRIGINVGDEASEVTARLDWETQTEVLSA